MEEIDPRIATAPFTEDQIKSINRFQKSGILSPITCSCNGHFYAREDGLTCPGCFSKLEVVPVFTTNWFWDKFKSTAAESENGIN